MDSMATHHLTSLLLNQDAKHTNWKSKHGFFSPLSRLVDSAPAVLNVTATPMMENVVVQQQGWGRGGHGNRGSS